MESNMVIKVKYGDTLRRFNARVDGNDKLDLNIDELRSKIRSLFNFPEDADLTMTYFDEDGDVVTLVDDDDLSDVMRQNLKFLRINVQVNNEKFGKAHARSSGSSTPLRSPQVQHPLPDINNKIFEILKSVPLCETLSKLSTEVTSKATSSSPLLSDLVDCFAKLGLSNLNVVPQSQHGAESSGKTETSENSVAPSLPKVTNASKGGGLKKVLQKSISVDSTSKTSKEVDIGIATRGLGAFVDINVPPVDSAPSGSSMSLEPPAARTTAGDLRMKQSNVNQTIGVITTSSADPTGPSNADNPHTADLGGNLSSECPIGGSHVENEFAGTSWHPRRGKRSMNRDALVGMFHKGVRCDGCGVHPIIGPRFKSKLIDDYDLCSICFADKGNEAEYIRIDRPVHRRHPRPFRGFHDNRQSFWLGTAVAQHVGAVGGAPQISKGVIKPGRPKLDSCFISDVNVLDGTMMAPSTPFTKIWKMRNTGNLPWPLGSRLVWIGGDKFNNVDSVEIEVSADGIPVEGELDIAVDFTAPELPGCYISYWRMSSRLGEKFGQRVWVLIEVDLSAKNNTTDSYEGLNLNFPPENSRPNCAGLVDVNVRPIVDEGFQEPHNSSPVNELKPVFDEQPKKRQEVNFPTNDSLLVGHGASASAPTLPRPHGLSTVSYPIIDLSEMDQPSHSPVRLPGVRTSGEIDDKDDVEQSLLKELEQMGFRQIDLKEILRVNEYDLEKSVDDLCGVSEWDPILEELQEMGFRDEETNKRLLKKNNGSIKLVVMDLLTGEKA